MSATQPTPETLLTHAGFVRRLARSLLGDAHLAEDVSQDALLAALAKGPRAGGRLRPWLAQVTRNFAAHSVRSRGRASARELDRPQPQGSPDPQEILEREQLRTRVVRAVLDLDEAYRAPILLRFYEDLPSREIAARLDLPHETVRTRLRRGMERLRARLEKDGLGLAALLPSLGEKAAMAPAGLVGPFVWATGFAKIAAACAVATTLGFLWLRPNSGGSDPASSPLSPGAAPQETEQTDLGQAPDGATRQVAMADQPGPSNPSSTGPQEPAMEEPTADQGSSALELRFVDPIRGPLTVREGSLQLTADGIPERLIPISNQTSLQVDLVLDLEYSISMQAPGLDHYEQKVTLQKLDQSPEHIVLWPDQWVALRVRTPRGEAFGALAEHFQVEPKRIFVHAFEAEVRLLPPASGELDQESRDTLAAFHEPPTWQAWNLPGSCIGSLELKTQPPLWVSLSLYGVVLDWKPLTAGQRVVDFEVDAAAFETRFASIRARIAERAGGSGLRDVQVTLKAETSAHRRHEHTRSRPDERGQLHLQRIVPGRYGLTLECGGSIFQTWLELQAGQELDLGEVLLQPGAGIPLQVLDEDGQAVVGYVEIAPYRQGAAVDELYHPNLHRKTEPDGSYVLPLPSSPSIVRVTQVPRPRNGIGNRRTPNVLLDPDNPPLETLVITARHRLEVRVAGIPNQSGRIQLIDSLGLIMETHDSLGKPWSVHLTPGSYEARLLGPAGKVLGSHAFDLVDEPVDVQLP